MKNDMYYMNKALELAKIAYEMGEVPVGAVVVKKSTGEIVGEGFNRREVDKNSIAHAEILAINQATLEPCPMCAGAIINSRIKRVIYGASDLKSGSCGSVVNLFELPYNHKPQLLGGILKDECSGILSDFFRSLREGSKK